MLLSLQQVDYLSQQINDSVSQRQATLSVVISIWRQMSNENITKHRRANNMR